MMSTRILLIAHSPLAHALRECALHVFPDADDAILSLDVAADAAPEDTLVQAQCLLEHAGGSVATLVMADVLGATPCNVAQRLLQDNQIRLVAGVNLPMLLRAVCYRGESLDDLVQRALMGGSQGIVPVEGVAS